MRDVVRRTWPLKQRLNSLRSARQQCWGCPSYGRAVDWACKRVVGVHKGLPWEMKVSAIRPEGCIPKVVQRKQIGKVIAVWPDESPGGCGGRTQTGLIPAALTPYTPALLASAGT